MKPKHAIFQSLVAVILMGGIACGADCDPNQSGDPNEFLGITIALTGFDVNDTNLELSYTITNKSENEAWICEDITRHSSFETFITEDPNEGHTLHIRRRLDVPTSNWWIASPEGRYVCLDANDILQETIAVPIPVQIQDIYFSNYTEFSEFGEVCAKNLAVEIGYYVGDLPEMIRNALNVTDVHLSETNDELWVYYSRQQLGGERVFQILVKGVLIPVDAHPYFSDV